MGKFDSFRWGLKRVGVKLNTHLHLVPMFKMHGNIPPLSYVFLTWCLVKWNPNIGELILSCITVINCKVSLQACSFSGSIFPFWGWSYIFISCRLIFHNYLSCVLFFSQRMSISSVFLHPWIISSNLKVLSWAFIVLADYIHDSRGCVLMVGTEVSLQPNRVIVAKRELLRVRKCNYMQILNGSDVGL
jgi:hypothetical protein